MSDIYHEEARARRSPAIQNMLDAFASAAGIETDFVDWDWLDHLDTIEETEYFEHVRTTNPMLVVINGKKREGRIIKPGPAKKWLDK